MFTMDKLQVVIQLWNKDSFLSVLFNLVIFIQIFGSEELKSKYLPKMISGQLIGAVCIADDNCGCDPNNTTTKAMYIPEEGIFHLTGKEIKTL
jgi:alkylation response protein AidB-like acyl-CoA dehydrogenase